MVCTQITGGEMKSNSDIYKKFSSSYKTFYITNTVVAVVVSILFYVSFFANNSENYLFPQLIVGGMAILALLLWFETGTKETTKSGNLKALIPGLGVCVAYVLLMDFMGFYLSSIVAFFVIVMIYRDHKKTDYWRESMIKLGASIAFMSVLYVLFTELLHVRMPQGIFF